MRGFVRLLAVCLAAGFLTLSVVVEAGFSSSRAGNVRFAPSGVDTDGDGLDDADPTELDIDGDGVANSQPPSGTDADACPFLSDCDFDGIADNLDGSPQNPDVDGDGILDGDDDDIDGDGIANNQDVNAYDSSLSADADGDGIDDSVDTDWDNDGVANAQDAFPRDATEIADTDGDGIGNNADTDDDGDGVADASDAYPLDDQRTLFELANLGADLSGLTLDTNFQAQLPAPTGNDGGGSWSYAPVDPSICTVSGTVVTPLVAGNCALTLRVDAIGLYDSGSLQTSFTVSQSDLNTAPTASTALTNSLASISSPIAAYAWSFTLPANSFSDPDPGQTIQLGVEGLPAWATWDAATRTISGTPQAGDAGDISFDIVGNDGVERIVEVASVTVLAAPPPITRQSYTSTINLCNSANPKIRINISGGIPPYTFKLGHEGWSGAIGSGSTTWRRKTSGSNFSGTSWPCGKERCVEARLKNVNGNTGYAELELANLNRDLANGWSNYSGSAAQVQAIDSTGTTQNATYDYAYCRGTTCTCSGNGYLN